jgi:methylated-DNA-[protein]-cysteine S-methyltransferase
MTAVPITIASSRIPRLGRVLMAAHDGGLCGIALPDWNDHELQLGPWEKADFVARPGKHRLLDQGFAELKEYAAGKRTRFDIALDLDPLPAFTRKVLRTLLEVGHGKLLSYGELAARAGSPRAARAVGGAVGRNPIPVIIPCHRVVASNGIGGFGLGLECKRALLAIEGVTA